MGAHNLFDFMAVKAAVPVKAAYRIPVPRQALQLLGLPLVGAPITCAMN